MAWFIGECKNIGIPVPPIFIETGSYRGDNIAYVLESTEFTEIHSIELSEKWKSHCEERFMNEKRVHLHLGDSTEVLETFIPTLPKNVPILVYLDAHYSGGETAGEDIDKGCPVLRELEILKKYRKDCVDDVYIVDDIRLMGKATWSGNEGSSIYPRTFFDFTHVSLNNMKTIMGHKKSRMSSQIDRLIFFNTQNNSV
jgi:hypothetical protein